MKQAAGIMQTWHNHWMHASPNQSCSHYTRHNNSHIKDQ